MTKTQKKRLVGVSAIILVIASAVALTLYALKQNISLFYTPSQVAAGESPEGKLIRIGGLVEKGSLKQKAENLKVTFKVTDNQELVTVFYEGILPDLFREGQGIVVQGRLNEKQELYATQVLAKHDENYVPPEVAKSLHQKKNKEKD